MRNLYRKISLFLSLILVFSILLVPNNVKALSNKSVDIQDKEALKVFNSLNNTDNANDFSYRSALPEDPTNIDKELEELSLLSIKDKEDIEIIYNSESENIETVVAHNKNKDSYILLEFNNNSNDISILVGNEEVKLVAEGENVYGYSKKGKKIPIIETEYQNENQNQGFVSNNPVTNSLNETKYMASSSHSFGPDRGPFYKTNKTLVTVLGAVSAITTAVDLVFPNGITSTISVASGLISWVGDQAYVTLYIKYYQAFSTSNPTYVRETANYYTYNNYTGFVKQTVSYFYSSKPY